MDNILSIQPYSNKRNFSLYNGCCIRRIVILIKEILVYKMDYLLGLLESKCTFSLDNEIVKFNNSIH